MRTPTMPAPMMILSLLEELVEGFADAGEVTLVPDVGAGDVSVGIVSTGVEEGDVIEDGPCLTAIGTTMAWEASFLFPIR